MDRLALADALEKSINDPDNTADMFGEYTRMHLPTIFAALRASDTGRSEAEAMREACARHCEARADYFNRSPGYRNWDDAARSYRRVAEELRGLPTLTAGGSQ